MLKLTRTQANAVDARSAVHCWVCGSTRFTSRVGHCLDWRACQIDFAQRLDRMAEIVDATLASQ